MKSYSCFIKSTSMWMTLSRSRNSRNLSSGRSLLTSSTIQTKFTKPGISHSTQRCKKKLQWSYWSSEWNLGRTPSRWRRPLIWTNQFSTNSMYLSDWLVKAQSSCSRVKRTWIGIRISGLACMDLRQICLELAPPPPTHVRSINRAGGSKISCMLRLLM